MLPTPPRAVGRLLVHALLVGLLAAVVLAPAARAGTTEPVPVPEAQWPLHPDPRVVEGFDPPLSPWGAGHRGVDLAGSVGQPVRAAQSGTVSFAGRIAGRSVVVVDHGISRTTYEPVDPSVHLGDDVATGDRIGTLALFGSHCFPRACLHWGLLEGQTYLDPLTLVGAGPVRLLPFLTAVPLPPAASEGGSVPQLPGWRPLGSAQLFR